PRTRKSLWPRKTILVGWFKFSTTVINLRFESSIVGPSGADKEDRLTVSVPKRPCCSFEGPAVKNNVLEELEATARPNCSPQTPSIWIGLPLASIIAPSDSPESKSNALTEPSPKLSTNS